VRIEKQADKPLGPDDILNPRGATARDYAATAKQAAYLSIVCAHWLNYKPDVWAAMNDEPTTDMPTSFPDAKRFNKARKLCGAWDTSNYGPKRNTLKFKDGGLLGWTYTRNNKRPDNPDSIKVADPKPAAKWDWFQVFNYWLEGGLERNIEEMLALTTKDQAAKVRQELNDF
jgi:hypothetical protein